MSWQLQEAKQKFSELIERTLRDGPQIVTRRGEGVVVIVPVEEFERLTRGPRDFKQFLSSAPDLEDLEAERSGDRAREVELT